MTATMSAWQKASRVLCVRLDNMGDVLMTTPAIRALKQRTLADGTAAPRHVTLLGSIAGCEVARQVPEIDATLALDAPWMAVGRDAPVNTDFVARLAAYRFDAAVIFTCYSQSALPAAMLCGQAGIPLRLGHCRENPYALLTDWIRDPEPEAGIRHEVERQLALVANVGATTTDERLSIRVVPAAQGRVASRLAARGIVGPYVVVHPGATAASRRWPAVRFGAVAARIHEATGMPVVVTGSIGEADLAVQVAAGAGCTAAPIAAGRPTTDGEWLFDATGALSLDELVALIDGAALLVSNNSGPAHIAAARQTPTVDLYALTNPQHTPWRVPSRVLSRPVPCANCMKSVCSEQHHACLAGVTVDDACDAAMSLLAECDRLPPSIVDGFAAAPGGFVDGAADGLPAPGLAIPAHRSIVGVAAC